MEPTTAIINATIASAVHISFWHRLKDFFYALARLVGYKPPHFNYFETKTFIQYLEERRAASENIVYFESKSRQGETLTANFGDVNIIICQDTSENEKPLYQQNTYVVLAISSSEPTRRMVTLPYSCPLHAPDIIKYIEIYLKKHDHLLFPIKSLSHRYKDKDFMSRFESSFMTPDRENELAFIG